MLANFVRQRRERLGLSLAQLAARANTTKGYLHQLEKGDATNPTVSMICALASGLQIGATRLFRIAAEIEAEKETCNE